MAIDDGPLGWQKDALCAQPENKDKQEYFFSNDPAEKNEAKNLCFACPVRQDCVKYALETKTIEGIWGGKSDSELRRTLSVNAEGNEIRRKRAPQCPYCGERTSRLRTKSIDLPEGGRWSTARVVECTRCGFEWRSRSSANAVDAYFAERAAKAERRAKAKEKAAADKKRRKMAESAKP